MEIRVQHILLNRIVAAVVGVAVSCGAHAQADKPVSGTSASINSEVVDVGVTTGIINIQNFGSEFLVGVNASFKATEDFFLQFNYLQADVGLSSYEQASKNPYFSGDERTFSHYDLLVGVNLFQGEFFYSQGKENLASLYLVGGVGDSKLGGESSFTYTAGVGAQVAFLRRYIARLDYRNYSYSSPLIYAEERTVNNAAITASIGYLF